LDSPAIAHTSGRKNPEWTPRPFKPLDCVLFKGNIVLGEDNERVLLETLIGEMFGDAVSPTISVKLIKGNRSEIIVISPNLGFDCPNSITLRGAILVSAL
jgi:hypothetical protein